MMRVARALLLALGGVWLAPGHAQEADDPGLDLLEYLGSWQDSDEDWLVVAEWEREQSREGRKRRRRGQEKDDGEGE